MATQNHNEPEADEHKENENIYTGITTWEELLEALDVIEMCAEGPLARVSWTNQGIDGGWLLNNPDIDVANIFLPGPLLVKMAGVSDVGDIMEARPRIPDGIVKQALREIERGWATTETNAMFDAAASAVRKIEECARIRLIAKKIQWLEGNPYPTDKNRRYWPTWYDSLCRVDKNSIVCKDCLAIPKWKECMRKPAWNVLHISDSIRVTITAKTPCPTIHDQFFQCPTCSGMSSFSNGTFTSAVTPMWVIKEQDFYQPCGGSTVDSRYFNSNWLAYVPKHFDENADKNKRRKRKDPEPVERPISSAPDNSKCRKQARRHLLVIKNSQTTKTNAPNK